MNELNLTAQYIYNTLLNNQKVYDLVQERIFRNAAPPDAGTPCIIFNFDSGLDVNAIGHDQRLFTRPIFLIKAVTVDTDTVPVGDISDAIDEALVGKSDLLGASGLVVQGVYRESPVDFWEDSAGLRYNYMGGYYRLFVHKTPA